MSHRPASKRFRKLAKLIHYSSLLPVAAITAAAAAAQQAPHTRGTCMRGRRAEEESADGRVGPAETTRTEQPIAAANLSYHPVAGGHAVAPLALQLMVAPLQFGDETEGHRSFLS
jgi:hypothetical protein